MFKSIKDTATVALIVLCNPVCMLIIAGIHGSFK